MYKRQEVSRTTLCQGRVTVETFAGDVVRMIPGQQLSVDESGETELREVNTDIYMAWMKGEYYFDSRTIEEVLTELEKWFEINEVEFTDASFKQRLFSGKFKKSDGLEIILRTMERGIEAVSYTHLDVYKRQIDGHADLFPGHSFVAAPFAPFEQGYG